MLQTLKKLRLSTWSYRPTCSVRWYSDDEKPDKKQKPSGKEQPKAKPIDNKEAISRLNALLESMPSTASKSKIEIPLAPNKKKTPSKESKESLKKHIDALRDVSERIAKKIGGNTEKTEAELLSQLLGQSNLKYEGNLVNLIADMKVESEPIKKKEQWKDQEYSLAEGVRRSLGQQNERRFTRRIESTPGVVNLFGAEPMGLFEKASEEKDPLETWSKLQQRELKLAVTHPPRNYFEKMILWTEQGKLWKFPIDNEQGMDEEFATDFSEHVLLEMHLEGWCPTSGPVRQFMELVCVGLSKNHYFTAKEKKDHILWYKKYFEEKKDLLDGNRKIFNIVAYTPDAQFSQHIMPLMNLIPRARQCHQPYAEIFTNLQGKPSDGWFKGFKQRHPKVCLRKPELA
ncbi:CLUMA_CG001835, isoform A [Clunio marinus]|uniref:Small ribosomal subunit protein mS31 n=1 Tax=Clunio marinus TaxID=568069 RepID=A0A1J1HKJ6_9DIPT|nr:CLUMA_CG001835, isoform A [Clunio marinus]